MTRKEIEKRCLEEMQQTIPDTEALWQRIETQLPQQEVKEEVKPKSPIRMHKIRPIMTIAACVAIVVSLSSIAGRISIQNIFENISNKTSNLMDTNHAVKDEAMESPKFEMEQEAYEEIKNNYDSLRFPEKAPINSVIDYEMLVTGDMSFDEAAILRKTECIVIATLKNVSQDADTGEMVYELQVDQVFENTAHEGEMMQIRSKSAFVLQGGRTYVLPLYQNESEWKLASESTPQIELTLDNEVVFHDGWKSLCTYENDELEYFEYDEYRHKMRIANVKVLNQLLAAWEDAQNR